MELIQSVSSRIQQALSNEDTEDDSLQPDETTSAVHSIVILGHRYSYEESAGEGTLGYIRSWLRWDGELPDDIQKDILTRLNFTYRTNFEPIQKVEDGPSPLNVRVVFRNNLLSTLDNAINHRDSFMTDIGWGCMIRTGQSLLGNAIQMIMYGKDYRSADKDTHAITVLFEDRTVAPFSLHNFVKIGNKLNGLSPGEWFGPSTTANCIQKLVSKYPECGVNKCIVSVSSGDVSGPAVEKAFRDGAQNILILLGMKLGLNAVNKKYWEDIKMILESEFSVGIAGGRPSSSLYFLGYCDDTLLYFDPHSAQAADIDDFNASCHTFNTGKLNFNDMDPSMLVGFLLTSSESWHNFKKFVENLKIVNILETMDNCQEPAMTGDQIFQSPVLAATQSPEILSDDDYVDVGAILGNGSCTDDRDAGYQDIECKNQKIVVVGSTVSKGTPDVEIEKVLVGQGTKTIDPSDT